MVCIWIMTVSYPPSPAEQYPALLFLHSAFDHSANTPALAFAIWTRLDDLDTVAEMTVVTGIVSLESPSPLHVFPVDGVHNLGSYFDHDSLFHLVADYLARPDLRVASDSPGHELLLDLLLGTFGFAFRNSAQAKLVLPDDGLHPRQISSGGIQAGHIVQLPGGMLEAEVE
jgi:hypothetical protein